MASKNTLVIPFTEEGVIRLRSLKLSIKDTDGDVIKKALALYEVAMQNQREEGELHLVNKDRRITKVKLV